MRTGCKVLPVAGSADAEENEFYKLTKYSIPFSGSGKTFDFEELGDDGFAAFLGSTPEIFPKCGRRSDCVAVSPQRG